MKKNKIIVTLLVVIIVLLVGIIGFGGYKYMELQKDNDKLTNNNKTITEELNKQKEESEKAKTEQEKASSTNDYSLFVKQMKEERGRLSKSLDYTFNENIETYYYHKSYSVNLTEDGVLKLTIGSKNITVAENVILYRVVYLGNGAYRSLFYVTEEGYVYTANVEELVNGNTKSIKSVKQKEAKEIVAILPGGSGQKSSDGSAIDPGIAHPFFVDINGNIYPYVYTE